MFNTNKKIQLVIIGLGYVGLPLALEFAKKRSVIGFDINKERIKELKNGFDRNLEFGKKNRHKPYCLNLIKRVSLLFVDCIILLFDSTK